MACINQFVRDVEFYRMINDIREVQLIVNAANKDKPMGSNVLNLISNNFRSDFPISIFVSTSPTRCFQARSSDLVSQIHSDNSGIIFIPFGHFSQTLKELFLRILFIIPQSITIIRPTTPLGLTRVIIQYNHQSTFS